jgi:hypothetical protein
LPTNTLREIEYQGIVDQVSEIRFNRRSQEPGAVKAITSTCRSLSSIAGLFFHSRFGSIGLLLRRSLFLLSSIAALTSQALGGGGVSDPRPVVDTHALEPGLARWIVEIYNHDLVLYGLTVVGVMAAMGMIIGFVMDFLVSRIGINLGKLERRE